LACSSPGPTQSTVVVRPGDACGEATIAGQDPFETALARARCEHPDMLVHPGDWVLQRVASPPNVRRFALTRSGAVDCVYQVDMAGRVRRAP